MRILQNIVSGTLYWGFEPAYRILLGPCYQVVALLLALIPKPCLHFQKYPRRLSNNEGSEGHHVGQFGGPGRYEPRLLRWFGEGNDVFLGQWYDISVHTVVANKIHRGLCRSRRELTTHVVSVVEGSCRLIPYLPLLCGYLILARGQCKAQVAETQHSSVQVGEALFCVHSVVVASFCLSQ